MFSLFVLELMTHFNQTIILETSIIIEKGGDHRRNMGIQFKYIIYFMVALFLSINLHRTIGEVKNSDFTI